MVRQLPCSCAQVTNIFHILDFYLFYFFMQISSGQLVKVNISLLNVTMISVPVMSKN